MIKIDNYDEFLFFINNLDYKPKLLLHACCGPCTTGVIDRLINHFDITIFYANDNMDTLEEFVKRQEELLKVANIYNVKVVTKQYEPNRYYGVVKGHEHDGEFSRRCYNCMELRLEDSALYAKDNGFDFFTTTLSVSPYKSSQDINEIGFNLSEKYQINYLYSNFKREGGYKLSVERSKELHLYRQEYCGCIYSKLEHEERINEKKN